MFHADHPPPQIHEQIAPQNGEIVCADRVLDRSVRRIPRATPGRGNDTLILAGISTTRVVLSAVADAHDPDYRLIVISRPVRPTPQPEYHTFLPAHLPPQAESDESASLHELVKVAAVAFRFVGAGSVVVGS